MNAEPTTRPISVVKVGGSLFNLPDLRNRLEQVLSSLSTYHVAVVSGGGAAADLVRHLQPVHQLTESAAHRVAMESLAVGEALLCELISESERVATLSEAHRVWSQGRVAVVNAAKFATAEQLTNPRPLEETWQATSDSIAAWVATVVQAHQLILLKSVDALSLTEASQHTDTCFNTYIRGIPRLQWCNLRKTTEFTELSN